MSMQPGETVEVTAYTAVSAVWGLEPVYYIDAHGVRQGPVTDYTLVTETTEDWNRSGSDSGWYVVRGTVEINTHEGARVRVNNTGVNLILCDGATLIAPWGITVNAGTGLTIWAQSKGGAKGALIADCSRIFWEDNYSAIGGFGVSCGTITINGGYIEAAGGAGGAVGLHVRLVDHIEAEPVAKPVEQGIVGVVAGADRVDVQFLHQLDVLFHPLPRHHVATVRIQFVPVHAFDQHAFPVDQQV